MSVRSSSHADSVQFLHMGNPASLDRPTMPFPNILLYLLIRCHDPLAQCVATDYTTIQHSLQDVLSATRVTNAVLGATLSQPFAPPPPDIPATIITSTLPCAVLKIFLENFGSCILDSSLRGFILVHTYCTQCSWNTHEHWLLSPVHHRGDAQAPPAIVSCCHCDVCLYAPAPRCATLVAANWGWPRSGRKKKFVCRAKYGDNRTAHSIATGNLWDGYKPARTTLHHQLQKSPTEIDRLLHHHISAISAVKLDLLLDDG
jgi:hypothetical protein